MHTKEFLEENTFCNLKKGKDFSDVMPGMFAVKKSIHCASSK